jgi:TonB-dependent receptor
MDNFIFDYTEKNYTENDHIWKKYTQPMNGAKAALYGAEVSYQRKFDFLPGFWSGFGIYANYTYTQSSVDGLPMERADVDELGLPGTCQNMVNGSLFFEKYGLNLRVSMNYATDYIDELGSESFYDRYYDSQLFVDVNASYAINANFTIFVDAVNLTDQPLRYYQGSRDRTMQMEYYAQRVTAGGKYNF